MLPVHVLAASAGPHPLADTPYTDTHTHTQPGAHLDVYVGVSMVRSMFKAVAEAPPPPLAGPLAEGRPPSPPAHTQKSPAASAAHLDVWVRVCARGVSYEHAVALAVVAGPLGAGLHLHQAAVRVDAAARTDALGHNAAARVPADRHSQIGRTVSHTLFQQVEGSLGEGKFLEIGHQV